jgi:hypothetical protein
MKKIVTIGVIMMFTLIIPICSSEGQPSTSLKQILLIKAPLIDVEHEDPKTVVLAAREETLLTTNGTLSSFWDAIGIVKQYGYTLDEVTTSGMGSQGNPTRFYAIMSKP